MSTPNSQGIQTLIDAENEASNIVQNARQCKDLIILNPYKI